VIFELVKKLGDLNKKSLPFLQIRKAGFKNIKLCSI
jgi:hypothetical protein